MWFWDTGRFLSVCLDCCVRKASLASTGERWSNGDDLGREREREKSTQKQKWECFLKQQK